MIKTKLHRVYSLFCPALLSGRFLTEGNIMQTPSVVTFALDGTGRNDSPTSGRPLLCVGLGSP